MSAQILQHLWFLRGCEEVLMIELSLKLHRVAYGAHEQVSLDKFSIITRGLLARKGVILSRGEYLGDDVLLISSKFCVYFIPHLAKNSSGHRSHVLLKHGGARAPQLRSCATAGECERLPTSS
eukprot:7384357-Prymnesium_polylepis.3